MMEYVDRGRTYGFSYRETRTLYQEFVALSDKEFKARIADALHLATFICYVKEVPSDEVLGDHGLVHELIHALTFPAGVDDPLLDWDEIRRQFRETLELA